MLMQILVVGDIHGCYVELLALLEKAGLGQDDIVIALGDFIDRGSETPQVLNYFQNTPYARAMMGNHERKHVRAARGELALALSQRISCLQLGDAYAEAVAWMGTLPLYIEAAEAILVHGYLEPEVPLVDQHPSVLCGTMGGERFLRERYDRPWYEHYDGEKAVVVGHHNYTGTDQPFVYRDKVFGLDTSCVHGLALTGLLLPSFRILSVPSRGDLWAHVRETRLPPRAVRARPEVTWSEQDELALARLIEKVRQAHRVLLDRVRFLPGYVDLSPREQAKRYAAGAGRGPWAVLLQLARLGALNVDAARRVLKTPEALHRTLAGWRDSGNLSDDQG